MLFIMDDLFNVKNKMHYYMYYYNLLLITFFVFILHLLFISFFLNNSYIFINLHPRDQETTIQQFS